MEINAGKRNRLTLYIAIALVAGITLGFVLNKIYVGRENIRIANADAEVALLEARMQVFRKVKDSAQLLEWQRLQSILSRQKQEAEQGLLDQPDGSGVLQRIELLKDSMRKVDAAIAAQTDTGSMAYQNLAQQKSFVQSQKSATLKARDRKLEGFTLLADIFLRLIKMIVAPLVFTTLVVGVAKLEDIGSVGRIGGKTLLWFLCASLLSLLLGMILVNIFQPGIAMQLPLPENNAQTGIDKAALTVKDFIYHVVPSSFIEAMAKNEILQIVVFSVFFGVAVGTLGEYAKPLVRAIDIAAQVILKVTSYVMNVAPLAVFGAITAIIAKQGLGILGTYSVFILEFYFGLLVLWICLTLAGFFFLRSRVFDLLRRMREPILIAFSTSSSEAAFPKTMLELEKFGCRSKIVSFVLPLGYSFNLDGSMMYMTFASLFIAQSYGIHIPMADQITMLLILMLTSKGIAGVPRASLVVIAGTLASFHIPEAGIALLLGIDPLLDMGRSATNVVGNSVATAVVSKWEGDFQ